MSRPHPPVVPGDQDRPDWWGPQDDAILAGELRKLDALPRVALPQRTPAVPAGPVEVTAPPYRLLALLAVVLLAALLVGLVSAWPASTSPGGPVVTPTTYAPPGPRGGFTSMPAR